jgi:plasmid maintenance system antidote protein VapI
MVEKEAIEIMNHWIEYEKQNKDKINRAEELIEIQETILDIINKKDKIITEMAKKINEAYCQENSFFIWFEENFGIRNEGDYSKEIKNYFNGKVVS